MVVRPIARVSPPIKKDKYISVIFKVLIPRLSGKSNIIAMAATVGMIEKQIDLLERTKSVPFARWGQDAYDNRISELMTKMLDDRKLSGEDLIPAENTTREGDGNEDDDDVDESVSAPLMPTASTASTSPTVSTETSSAGRGGSRVGASVSRGGASAPRGGRGSLSGDRVEFAEDESEPGPVAAALVNDVASSSLTSPQ